MKVSIMITTLNRSAELKQTLSRIRSLQPPPDEILVTSDGCSDKTVEILQTEFPDIILSIHERSQGSVASRSEMMEQATGDLVLALDDDSYPEQQNCLEILVDVFTRNPNLAVATFPQRTDEYPETLTQVDFGPRRAIRSFPNSGACIRVSSYRQLPGFEPIFFHMYEEPDYALQCIGRGWEVEFIPEITIRHHWTSKERSALRNHHRHARNELWSTLMRCPFPHAFAVLFFRIFSQAKYAAKRGPKWLVREPLWWGSAIAGIPQALRRRNPVPLEGFRRWLSLPDK